MNDAAPGQRAGVASDLNLRVTDGSECDRDLI